jgi:Flp pilus assembly protein TadG
MPGTRCADSRAVSEKQTVAALTAAVHGRCRLRARRDERGVETAAIMIVLPTLIVLIFALLEFGFMIQTRMAVENTSRDTVRRIAADGGNLNPRTNAIGRPWSQEAMTALYSGGQCKPSRCDKPPVVTCTPTVAGRAGEVVTCKITYYYRPLNKALLDSPIGLGMGRLITTPFQVTSSARAETGAGG